MVANLTFDDVQRMAQHVGLQVLKQSQGALCLLRGSEVLYRAEDLEDAAGWLVAWERYVV